MLHLSTLLLSHFRSHKLARLTFDQRPVAIYGNNGSGKTNILEAVSLFSPGRGMRRASALEMTRRPESLGWQLQSDLVRDERVHQTKITSDEGAARRVWIDDKPVSQLALGEKSRVIWLIPAMDRLWIEGAEGRRRFLDRITLSFFPSHAEASLNYEKAMRERNKLLKEQIRDAHWYRAIELQMAQTGIDIHTARMRALDLIQNAQDTASTEFPVAQLTLERSEGDMPTSVDDLKSTLEESRFRDMAAGRTLVGPHRTDMVGVFQRKGVLAKDCSTGEQKALLISMILANARALKKQIGAAPLVLLDEVSAHLDNQRRAALYQEVCNLGAQAWMTGTEIDVFQELGDRAQAIHVTDADGLSNCTQHDTCLI